MQIPLFPLPGALLFPRSQLPLHIFEPRYREMVTQAIESGAQIGMIQPTSPEIDGEQQPLYAVGCAGEIANVEHLEDGRFNILLNGISRFRLLEEIELDTPYRNARVDLTAFDDSDPEPLALAQRSAVEHEARRLGDALGLIVDWEAVGRLDDEMLVNAIAQVAPFDVSAKQALLEAEALANRADLLVQLMEFLRLSQGSGDLRPTLQ